MATIIVRAARALADDLHVMASALTAYGRRAGVAEPTLTA